MTGIECFVKQFRNVLKVEWWPPRDLRKAAIAAIDYCGVENAHGAAHRQRIILGLVNRKFDFNGERVQSFLDRAATRRVFLNYHDKVELRQCLDLYDFDRMRRWLADRRFNNELEALFEPISNDETLALLDEQLKNPTVARSDARACRPGERRESILRSLFGSFIFCSFPVERMHAHLNPDCKQKYLPDFYDHLLHFHPTVVHRRCALVFAVFDDAARASWGHDWRDGFCGFIEDAYARLSNHCYFALLVKPFRDGDESGQWRLFSDIVLFAEKFREVALKAGYFHPREIEAATRAHIPLPAGTGKFELANEGFFFRDCIVLPRQETATVTDADCEILLLFEKDERDETLVPCPACRSRDVRGNSYPVLGVKSWECQNAICPERSAFDRGDRYSIAALVKQQAIKSEADQISTTSLRRWKLDVVPGASEAEVGEMLLRHFSLHGDSVRFVNTSVAGEMRLGRRIEHARYEPLASAPRKHRTFQSSAMFSRFVVERPADNTNGYEQLPTRMSDVELYHGDSFHVLSGLPANSIDGAVTSPPYYNARSYSEWPNIYCYLFDMFNVTRMVYRVLRPGAYYLFNVFDYFDNENNIVLSSMGRKRMILGAYMVDLFRRVGFEIQGNTVWYKGEIEGKRNFNQGNYSPYYQLPFNCWEHVLIFRKPGVRTGAIKFPTVLAARPVLKMVRGENILGHSAPFPSEIPELLLQHLKPGQTVLDPYAGSMTTARTAKRRGIRSISVELHREYCELGLRLLNQEQSEKPTLFTEVSQKAKDAGRTRLAGKTNAASLFAE